MAYTAVDTWDITTVQAVNVSVRRGAVKGNVGDGVIHRRQTLSSQSNLGQAAVRTFTLFFPLASKEDYNKAVTLWKNSSGGADGINFTHTDTTYGDPVRETIIVRMVAAPLSLRKISHVQYAFEVKLEEMLHSPGV